MYCGDAEIKHKVTMIVAAAGVGKRMNLGYPKQFLEWKGKPLFIFPLNVAQKSSIIDDIIISTNPENIQKVREFCEDFGITKVRAVVAGGKERQDSIYNALSYDKTLHPVIRYQRYLYPCRPLACLSISSITIS